MMENSEKRILYPFSEETFSPLTSAAIQVMKRTPDREIVVNKKGRTTDAFDKAGLRYAILRSDTLVTPKDFCPVALARLFCVSLPQFVFMRQFDRPVDFVHFFDLTTAMTWWGTTHMFKTPYVLTVGTMEKFSKMASMTLKDARYLLASTPFVKETTPALLQRKMYVVPALSGSFALKESAARRERSAFLKKRGFKEGDVLCATDAPADDSSVKDFCDALKRQTGKNVCVCAFKGNGALPFSEWTEVVSACSFFIGFDDCSANAVGFFAALGAEIPVFCVRRGIYLDVAAENENAVFVDVGDAGKQAAFVDGFLNDEGRKKALTEAARRSYDALRKKTVDFMKEMYDSV